MNEKEQEPVAWIFDWVSTEVDKPVTSISFSYPVDEHEVFVSNIRPLYEKPLRSVDCKIDSTKFTADLEKFSADLIAVNAGLKNKIDALEQRIANGVLVYAAKCNHKYEA